jgi:PKD repeat protein
MKAHLTLLLCAAGAAVAVGSCSPGIGNNPLPSDQPPQTSQASTNLPVGLDIGLQPTDPISEPSTTGVVVPAIGAKPERDIVLLAFTTAANAADGDGSGTPLSRDAVTDGNGASDVFLAAVCAQDVDTRAFSQSLAGKFRHPRCATCHSMQRADTLAFVSSATSTQAGGFQPHAGPPPGPTFPNNDPETCIPCHFNSTLVPVDAWQAPAASFDLRSKSVAELAVAAQNIPIDETEHFVTDPRVLWALDSGILPTVGGRNGVADDDHDGIDEPSDRDGIPRPVPGGSAVFIQQIEEWNESGNLVTAAAAVTDITLVSRAASSTNAGNGASSRPQIIYVPNGSFSAPGTVGTIYIVYQSDASDLVAGDANGATDIFRTVVDLVSDAAGNLDLVINGDATAVSATNGTTNVGNGAATMAVVGGTSADLVAFQSLATDLVAGFTDANGAGSADIYLRNIASLATSLISHQTGNQATGGNGASAVPSIDATGVGVAFESDATDLIASDTNGVRDVFYADVSGAAPFGKMRASVSSAGTEGTGGICADASIYVSGGGRTLVAFESDKTDLATGLVATTNVYLYDSNTSTTTLLNQLLSTSVTAIGDGSARNPVIGADGANVAFESDASNIDVLRDDGNGVTDVFLADIAQVVAGSVLPYRFSLTTVEATDGNGASTEPRFSTFASTSSTFSVGFATYTTAATNLGTSDSTDLVVAFLDETSGVLADFDVSPTSGVAPLTVQFTDTSTGVPTEWQWDFDNDNTVDSTEQNPSFTYTTAGTYTVKLTASNAVSNNEVIKTNVVRAIGTIVPDFTATPTSGAFPLQVNFTDTSTEQPTAWSWNFGDNVTSTLQNPSHTYTAAGTYTVSMTATNEVGSEAVTKTNFIEAFAPVVAGFNLTPNAGVVPFTVSVTNTSTGATSYAWDFDEDMVIDSTDENPTFNYTTAGDYDVTLTATGPGGTDTSTIANAVIASGKVAASFTQSATSAYTNQNLTLDASGSTGSITLYEWDFDLDFGTIEATGINPTVPVGANFPTASQTAYTIRLRVSGPGGSATNSSSFTSVIASEDINIDASNDNTIYEDNTNNSNGAGAFLVVGRPSGSSSPGAEAFARRAMVQFNLASIPANSTINTAALQVVSDTPAMTGPETITIHRITEGWTEGTSNAGASAGAGALAAGNGATWINRTTPATAWSSAGGTFIGTSSGTMAVNTAGTHTSTTLVPNVQAWLDGTLSNFGWMLRSDETMPDSAKRFISREGATAPRLVINYTRPLP